MTDVGPTGKTARERSPSFPFIPLKAALERLVEFEKTFSRQDPPANRTYLAWGYKGDTSQAQQTLAALNAFGLVEYKGSGAARPVAITPDGRTYLRAQQDSLKQEVVKRVALKPKWIGHFWRIWGSDRIPDPIRLDELVLKHKFIESAAPNFLKVYDATIAFSGLITSDKDSDSEEDAQASRDPLPEMGALEGQRMIPAIEASPPARASSIPTIMGQGVGPSRVSITADGLEIVAHLNSVEAAEALREDLEGFITVLRNRELREKARAERQAESVAELAKFYEQSMPEDEPKQ